MKDSINFHGKLPLIIFAFLAFGCLVFASSSVTLPKSVIASTSSGNTNVNVFGTGFTPNVNLQFGYSPIPPYTNVVIDANTSTTGNWSGSFSAPWTAGSYNVIAIDADGFSATGTLVVIPASHSVLTLPKSVIASSSIGNTNVNVLGTGFTPNAKLQFGFSPIPPYTNVMIDANINANGNWSGSFSAPWVAGSYNMTAIDSNGLSAEGVLVVLPSTTSTSSTSSSTSSTSTSSSSSSTSTSTKSSTSSSTTTLSTTTVPTSTTSTSTSTSTSSTTTKSSTTSSTSSSTTSTLTTTISVLTGTQNNVAGYIVQAPKNSVTYVQGAWTVPKFSCPFVAFSAPSAIAGSWVGIDDDGISSNSLSATIEQVGTEYDCKLVTVLDVPLYYDTVYSAWYQFFPNGVTYINKSSTGSPVSVNPDDLIVASVKYEGAYQFLVNFTDITQHWTNLTLTTFPTGEIGSNPINRATADWIVEEPTSSAALPDFNTIGFGQDYNGEYSNYGVINGVTGSIGHFANVASPPFFVYNFTMSGKYGTTETTPISKDGTSFSVTWTGCGELVAC